MLETLSLIVRCSKYQQIHVSRRQSTNRSRVQNKLFVFGHGDLLSWYHINLRWSSLFQHPWVENFFGAPRIGVDAENTAEEAGWHVRRWHDKMRSGTDLQGISSLVSFNHVIDLHFVGLTFSDSWRVRGKKVLTNIDSIIRYKKFINYKSAVYSNNTSLTTAKSHHIVGNSPKIIWSFSITLLTKK